MLKSLKIFLFLQLSVIYVSAQNDTIFLTSGKTKIGIITSAPSQTSGSFTIKEPDKSKETVIKSDKIYKVVRPSGVPYIINNLYYLEKNKSASDYQKNLKKVDFYNHFTYGEYYISKATFFKIMKKLDDQELNKLCHTHKILGVTAPSLISLGGLIFTIGYFKYENHRSAYKQGVSAYNIKTINESAAIMACGAVCALTGIIIHEIKVKKYRQDIIRRYNSLLLKP